MSAITDAIDKALHKNATAPVVEETVETEDTEPKSTLIPGATYHNAPETIDAAIERIMELEMRLSDLHRAAEIAAVTKQIDIIEGFMGQAEEALKNKIVLELPQGPANITLITGELDRNKVTGAI